MEPEPEPEPLPGTALLDAIVLVCAGLGVLVLQTGVGTTTNFDTFRNVLKAPAGIVIGFFCQFGLLPFLAYLACLVMGFRGYLAVGLILICSAPGGTMSNAFVMYAYGDTSLSVVMTTLSCFVAFVTWPLLTTFYSGLLTGEEERVNVPILTMAGSILAGTLPVPLGAYLQRKSPAAGAMLRRIMMAAMIAAVVPAFLAQIVKQPTLVTEFNWRMAVAALVLNHTGFITGYAIAAFSTICCQGTCLSMSWAQVRTVPFECAVWHGPACCCKPPPPPAPALLRTLPVLCPLLS